MNIWILNHYAIPPSLGGLNRHYYFSKNLKLNGHQVEILTSSKIHNTKVNFVEKSKLFIKKIIDNVEYIFIKSSDYTSNGFSRVYNLLEFPVNLWKTCSRLEKPDIIYISSPDLFTAFIAILQSKKHKIPCVVEIRDLWPESIVVYKNMSRKNPIILALYGLEKWIYKNANKLIFTMQGGEEYIKERKWDDQINLNKVYNINNGVDLLEFDSNRINFKVNEELLNEKVFKVIYTGSIREVNNLKTVIYASEIIQKNMTDKIKIIIYGDGSERLELEKYVKDNKVTNIIFQGSVEKKYIPYILNNSNLNLMHSEQTEIMRFGCSLNKLFDYFAAGKPILSTLKPNYDLVERYGCGVSLESQTPEEIAKAVIDFYHMDENKRAEMGQKARRAALDYDFKNLTLKLENILQSAIAEYK